MSSENDLKIELGKRIRDLRKEHGLTQAEFAKRIQVSQPAVGRYEAGERTPDIYIAMNIIDQFGCTLEWLALGRGKAPTKKTDLDVRLKKNKDFS